MGMNDSSDDPYHWAKLDRNSLPEMMKEWYDVKKQYPNHLLAWRMGDFYEFFYHPDVKIVANLLGLTKTFRGSGNNRHPLAGIPHKATQHFKSLIKQGQTVVIVEQLEDPKEARGRIVKRGVVQILSPGTVIDESLLDAVQNNYLVAITKESSYYGVAFIDLSCGDFFCSQFKIKYDYTNLISLISRFEPVECIIPEAIKSNKELMSKLKESLPKDIIIKIHNRYAFQYDNAYQALIKHFNVKTLDGFGVQDLTAGICAAGSILEFLSETQKTVLSNITDLKRYLKDEIMFLDAETQKNLEILRNLNDNSQYASLLYILDKTTTPMGGRLMKKIIVQPLLNKEKIEARLEIVDCFKSDNMLRNDLREFLSEMGDMERIISRINYSRTANARDIVYLKAALKLLPDIQNILSGINVEPLKKIVNSFEDYTRIIELINSAIKNNPPTTITEGDIIKDGYDSRVDEMRDILANGKDWILKFEEKEKEKLQISAGFKIGFNRVLGYYIQITKHALKGINSLPENYIKRQTLKNSTRFETEELKQMEIKILNADETIKDIEYDIFSEIREKVSKYTKSIQKDAQKVAMLDILSAFGEAAALNNYCRPNIKLHDKIIIKKGRHPVVELINLSEPFIPNDCYMDTEEDLLLLITGPNWSGKSTYLRQVALVVIMAQIGSFVPAQEAEIGLIDRVFTRVGATDDLTRGQSTFMMEMNETAEILRYATNRSLVIVDELGRGTSTTDGKSIARAVMEYLHDNKIKTLFSTHFHELINIKLKKMKNYHFLIKEDGKKLVFLRKLTPGGTDKSYGIHVAMMAGVPEEVVKRAFVLVDTEYNDEINNQINKDQEPDIPQINIEEKTQKKSSKKNKNTKKVQTLLFKPTENNNDEIRKRLRDMNIEEMTPLEAMEHIIKLKKQLG
ncbi:MAG: DNA mismatch repair protein MutS [Candidatus Lokiarchaeota archaeon]|nr:DNA mismatch repair protein MutS [Candidatus Lokiarchaeota archaeon]